MRDLILREIDVLGKVIEAILNRLKIKESDSEYDAIHEELQQQLGFDIEELFESDNFITRLKEEYGFSDDNLDKLAEILFEVAVGIPNGERKSKLIADIRTIYDYLELYGTSFSLNRCSIIKELENTDEKI